MSKLNVMTWVERLPNVAATPLLERREQIGQILVEAEVFTRKAEALRAKAYFLGCSLEADAKGNWSYEVIEQAKGCTG